MKFGVFGVFCAGGLGDLAVLVIKYVIINPFLFININKEMVYIKSKYYIYRIYALLIYFKFNFHFIKLVTLKLYIYKILIIMAIGRAEKLFIKCLNIVVLSTASIPIKIFSIYV